MTRSIWAARIGVACAVWLAILLIARFFDMNSSPAALALVVGATGCVVWLLLDASASARSSYWRQDIDAPVRAPGEDPRVEALMRHLDRNLGAKASSELLHADLVAVADVRLMVRHGLSRVADPDRAADVLGRDLADFLALPKDAQRRLSPQEIDHILNRIESL